MSDMEFRRVLFRSPLAAQRNRAARWRATETNRQATPATLAAMAAFDAVQPALNQAASDLGNTLQTEDAKADTLARYQTLQTSLNGLDSKSLGTVGWWPDGYDRFTSADRKSTRLNSSH